MLSVPRICWSWFVLHELPLLHFCTNYSLIMSIILFFVKSIWLRCKRCFELKPYKLRLYISSMYTRSFNHRLAQFGGKLVFWGNLSPKDVRLLNLRDPFLAEIMEYWTTLNYKDNDLDFTSAQIWHNSLIRIENKPIFYKSWFTAGVKDVKDILDTDRNSILSYTAFTSKYKIKTNFLEFYKVVSALKLFRQKCSQQPNRGPKTKTFRQTSLTSEKACKTVYKSIIEKRPPPLLKARENVCLRKIL